MSQPVPIFRPSGTCRSRSAMTWSRGVPASTRGSIAIGVFISPGKIVFALMP